MINPKDFDERVFFSLPIYGGGSHVWVQSNYSWARYNYGMSCGCLIGNFIRACSPDYADTEPYENSPIWQEYANVAIWRNGLSELLFKFESELRDRFENETPIGMLALKSM